MSRRRAVTLTRTFHPFSAEGGIALLIVVLLLAVLCLILGFAEVAEFLIWVGLVGIGIFVLLALAGKGWSWGRRG